MLAQTCFHPLGYEQVMQLADLLAAAPSPSTSTLPCSAQFTARFCPQMSQLLNDWVYSQADASIARYWLLDDSWYVAQSFRFSEPAPTAVPIVQSCLPRRGGRGAF